MKTQNSVLTGIASLKLIIHLLLAVIIILFVTSIPNTKQTRNRAGYIQFNPLHQVTDLQCLVIPCNNSQSRVKAAVTDIFGNIVLFLPLGVIVSLILKQKNWRNRPQILAAFGSGLLFSLSIETMQYWLPTRVTSVHDIIYNSSGALFGAVLLTLFYAQYSYVQYRWQTSVATLHLILAGIFPGYPLKLQASSIKYSSHHHPN